VGRHCPPNGGEADPLTFNIFINVMREAANNQNMLRIGIPFFLGFVIFGDIFGNIYTLGFCFLFDRIGNRFILAGGDEYNYCHKERGPYVPPSANRLAPQTPTTPGPIEPDDGELATS
jgi:hypothetical protein